jgi:hypothetical protein
MLKAITRLADDEWPPGRLIEHAAAMGWAGIYDPREQDKRNVQRSSGTSPTLAAANSVLSRLERDESKRSAQLALPEH